MIRCRWLSAFAAILMLTLVVPAGAAQGHSLEVTVAFDKPAYRSGEWIQAGFTVKNVSSQRVSRVTVAQPWNVPEGLVFAENQWAEFRGGLGIDLEPGASHTVTLSGHTRRADSESVRVAGTVRDRAGVSTVEFSSTAAVTRTYGRAGGIAFADKNGSGAFDTGEELPSAPITLQYAHDTGADEYHTITDANGRFSFPSIPTTWYRLVNTRVDGWTVLKQSVGVDQSSRNDNLLVRAVRPVWGVLTPELKFTKDSYAPGGLAHVTVTLSNSGPTPLTGIVSYCNWEAHSHALWGRAWGELSSWASGVTVPAGRTMTFDVTEHVPDGAFREGYVVASCAFGYAGDSNRYDMPAARATASVPGRFGAITGEIAYHPEGRDGTKPRHPMADVRVVVVDGRPCHVAEQLTDKNGGFEFVNLPARPDYALYFYPPAGWRMPDRNPATPIPVSDGYSGSMEIEVVKGDGLLPALPKEAAACRPSTNPPATPGNPPVNNPPGPNPPANNSPGPNLPARTPPRIGRSGDDSLASPVPQAKPARPGLARTGAGDVPILVALGVLAVVLGGALMWATQRRETGDR